MALNSARLMKLLEHYRDRLHSLGDDYHDEELDYVSQIMSSPIFREYLNGQSSLEESSKITEVTKQVLESTANTEDQHLGTDEKRKRQLARKQSLRALRNAVTPQNSPRLKPKRLHSSDDKPDSIPVQHTSKGNSSGGSSVTQLEPRSRNDSTPSIPKLTDSSIVTNGTESPLSPPISPPCGASSGLHDARLRNLSNSTNTLIERPSPPGDQHQLRKKSSDSLLMNGIVSGSQPDVHRLTYPGPMALRPDLDPKHFLPPVAIGGRNIPKLAGESDWVHPHQLYHDQADGLSSNQLPLEPHTLYPPYIPQQNEQPRGPPPPYGHQMIPPKNSNSFEKLLESDTVEVHLLPAMMRPLVHPMTDSLVTQDLPTAQSRKTQLVIRLEKGEEGLGFRVRGLKNEQRGELGIYVQDMQPGGLAERDGRLRRNDQIISINGQSLEGIPHTEAVKMLQAARGVVELVILRDLVPSPPSPSTKHSPQIWQPPPPPTLTPPPPPPTEDQETVSENQMGIPSVPKQHRIETIELPNVGQGFGFGVIPRSNGSGTVVHSIVQGGIAEQDGRLKQQDQLLQINEESIIHMSYEDVVEKLKLVSHAGKPIRLVVSRAMSGHDVGVVPEFNDSSDEEAEEFEVELYKQNRGLGITIAGLVKFDTEEEVKGIYITSLNSTGAAARDGRVQVGDRIVKVDGHPLRGLENMEAAAVLRNSGNPIKLVLARKRKNSPVELKMSGTPDLPAPSEVQSPGLHGNQQESAAVSLKAEDEEELVEKWRALLGPQFIVKVAHVNKGSRDGGLGIRMESTAELDAIGRPQIGSIHHVIQYVHTDGPVGLHGVLQEGDEILEVNGVSLVDLSHDEAIEVVKDTPMNVTIVTCRPIPSDSETAESHTTITGSETPDDGAPTSESEDDKRRNSIPDRLRALPSIDFSSLGDFTRRFERQSWRERHEAERERLKRRFEQRREEYERHIQEQEEELLQQELELEERHRRQAEEEERRNEQKRSSTLLQFTEFDYTHYNSTQQPNFVFPPQLHSPESARDSFATDSSTSVLSPVPGSGLWDLETIEIEMQKGLEGLGFSVLDFADPLHPGDRVILVHSLVSGGMAERDSRLRVGDKVVSVNNISVVNHSLQFAVQQLVMVPRGGVVKIGVNHPLPASPEINSSPNSPLSSDLLQFFAEAHGSLDIGENESRRNATSVDFEMDEKPLSDDIVRLGEGEGEEDEDSANWKKKKPSDSEDDDPPPPYSKTDPQEDKFENPAAPPPQEPELPATGEDRKLATETSTGGSGAHLSRVTSPTRGGRTLSDLTRITPEDEARLQETHGGGAESSQIDSDSTLVNSGSQQDFSQTSDHVHMKPEQPKLVLNGGPLGRMGGRGSDPVRQGKESERQPLVLSYIQSQNTLSSQESFLEGLSPDMSDYGDHSAEVDTEPREIKIHKGSSSLGMNLTVDDKSSSIVVKSVVSNGAVRRDGRIRVGDRILTINGKPLEGVSLTKAKSILKRASSKCEEVSIAYIPAPQLHGYTLPSYGLSSSVTIGNHPISTYHTSILAGTPLHNISEQDPPQGEMLGTQGNIQMGPHGPVSMPPQPMLHQAMIRQSVPYPQPGTMPPMQIQGNFLEQATSLKPPPPYGYPVQPGMMLRAPNRPYQPPQPIPWGVQQQQQQPAMHMAPPPSQSAPSPWNIVRPREPPQYNELMAQQQMMQAAQSTQYQMTPSVPQLQMSQAMQHQITSAPQPLPGPPQHQMSPAPQHQMSPVPQHQMSPVPQHQMSPAPQHQMSPTPQHQMSPAPQHQMSPTPQHQMSPAPQHQMSPAPQHQIHSHSPRMSKSQSETKFHSGASPRPLLERRYNSHGAPRRAFPLTYRHRGKSKQQTEEENESSSKQDLPEATNSHDSERPKTRLIEVVKDSGGSLGINVGQLGDDENAGGVFVKSLSRRCKTASKGRLNTGDIILEVNNIDLRHATQAKAVNIIKSVGNPVRILVQSECTRPAKYPRSKTIQESPEHSHHNSWAIEEEEDPLLREEFPTVIGHLFEVNLNKGKSGGLGLSIVRSTDSQSVDGIVIMDVARGGVADASGKIKWGDMILKVNDTCVVGMSVQQVQELLAKSPLLVRFVMVRQHMNSEEGQTYSQAVGDSDISFDGLAKVKAITIRREGSKGFGFNISEGEKEDKSVVVVTSISQGGSAELDGQLQKGDQILSVDGQKVLGYSYEKVRHLLQQARVRGVVTLIVASRSIQLDGQKGSSEQGDGGAVVLRKKKRNRGSSLKTSRRRPVSVDNDMSVTIEGIPPGSSTQDDLYKRYSNRNSHPLTEREVEQGIQHFEREKAIVPGKECDIVIFKGMQALGLIIVGGTDTFLGGIYIKKIVPDSPAAKDGRLQTGDRLLKVGNVSLQNATCEDALSALQHSPAFVDLAVLRDPAMAPQIPLNEDQPPSSVEIETVELVKLERGLGLLICEKEDQPGVYVDGVAENEAAYKDGRIRPGDMILAINGQDMSNAPQSFVARTLQGSRSRGNVTLTVRHPPHLSQLRPQLDYGQPERDLALMTRPPPEYPYPAPSTPVRLPDRDPPPYFSSSPAPPPRPLQTTAGHDYITSHHHQGMYRGERRPPSPPLSQIYRRPPSPPPSQGMYRRPPSPSPPQGIYRRPPSPPPSQGIYRRPPSPPPSQGIFRRPPSPPPSQGIYRRPPSPPQGIYRRPPSPPPPQGMYRRPPSPPPPQGMYRRPPSPPPPQVYRRPPSPLSRENSGREQIKVIRLHRGPSGLGFTIVGGKDSPHGDLPIYIKRVFDKGAAGRDGRLRKGDQLLAVNGVSFESVSHQYAAEALKYLQGNVELTVMSTD